MSYELPANRWPNQIRAFDGVMDAMARGVKRLCVTSPTGTGKTKVITDLLHWVADQKTTAALYTHRKMLRDQLGNDLTRANILYGDRAAGFKPALWRDIQLVMTPTEASRVYKAEARELHDAKFVLVDERHQNQGPSFLRMMNDHVAAGAMEISFTATPLDLIDVDELLVAGSVSEGRECGALVVAETYAPDEPDLKHIRQYAVGEDLSDADNHKVIMRPGVFGRVKDSWLAHNPEQKPTILFGPDVKGSLFFAEQFYKAGIRAAHIDGSDVWLDGEWHQSDEEIRDRVAELSQAGEIKVVCNRFVLREGINWPWIECGIFATVFGSLTAFLQSGGRLLRASASSGKTKALILDHGGNYHRHGSLNEDREWTLGLTNHVAVGQRQENMREQKQPEPITCPQCSKVRYGGRQCPACGFIAHKKSRMVVQIDGTLRPVDGDIYRPRRTRRLHNERDLWRKIYFRAKSERWNATFRQAEAMYFREHFAWPPRDLPLMPKTTSDWWRKVADVPYESLIHEEEAHAVST